MDGHHFCFSLRLLLADPRVEENGTPSTLPLKVLTCIPWLTCHSLFSCPSLHTPGDLFSLGEDFLFVFKHLLIFLLHNLFIKWSVWPVLLKKSNTNRWEIYIYILYIFNFDFWWRQKNDHLLLQSNIKVVINHGESQPVFLCGLLCIFLLNGSWRIYLQIHLFISSALLKSFIVTPSQIFLSLHYQTS